MIMPAVLQQRDSCFARSFAQFNGGIHASASTSVRHSSKVTDVTTLVTLFLLHVHSSSRILHEYHAIWQMCICRSGRGPRLAHARPCSTCSVVRLLDSRGRSRRTRAPRQSDTRRAAAGFWDVALPIVNDIWEDRRASRALAVDGG